MIIDTVVVGAGHAGLAVSRMLAEVQRDHVVLDRGRVAERWRSERWDTLVLTPAWMTRLPGWHYAGTDPDGYLSSGELVQYLERYATSFRAPVIPNTTVVEVAASPGAGCARFRVVTDSGTWHARHVVVATGPHGRPRLPAGLARTSNRVEVLTASSYRNVDRAGLSREVLPALRPRSFDIPHPVTRLDLARERIGTVISAAGYRPDHPWLHVPVLAPDGSIRQRRGVTPAPGLYVVGQYFQHRRDSGFIDGARHDARHFVDHLSGGRASGRPTATTRAPAA